MDGPQSKQLGPRLLTSVPGPESCKWSARSRLVSAPMGPPRGADACSLVFARASGVNVWDVDGNRFVDLAAGFGSLLLGHGHPRVTAAIHQQADTLLQAMGDVYPAALRIELLERLAALFPEAGALSVLAQSGSDAVDVALKSAVLATGKSGVIAFTGAYHGLGHGPLSICGLRPSYREPFTAQLNPGINWHAYPAQGADVEGILAAIEVELRTGRIGAIVIEPILGRGGVTPLASGVAARLRELATHHGALLVMDEIWTGLGRAGSWLTCVEEEGVVPDVICLGKGLGGGLPISACVGRARVMRAWAQPSEVVHTSTFAGAPLACATALATLDVLQGEGLVARASSVGARLSTKLRAALAPLGFEPRGRGMMIGIDTGHAPGSAVQISGRLAREGYLVSTGGGARQTIVLTPPLTVDEALLDAFVDTLRVSLLELSA